MRLLAKSAALVAAVALCVPAAVADPTIADAKKAYEALKKQGMATPKLAPGTTGGEVTYQATDAAGKKVDYTVWVGSPRLITPVEVATKDGPKCTLGLRVWAELSDAQGTHTGKYVNIQRYGWGRSEYFYFWFETAIPVQISLMQYYDVGPAEAKNPKLVSPDPKFPKTYSTVPAGRATYFPQLFRTDDTNADEFVTLTVVAAGAPVTPITPAEPGKDPPPATPLPINQPQGMGGGINVFGDTSNALARATPPTTSTLGMPKSASLVAVVDPMGTPPYQRPPELPQTTADNPDQVSIFYLGNQQMGHLPLRFWHRR
jgi:hypothetical protein